MKLLYEFIILIVALILRTAKGDEAWDLYRKYCPLCTNTGFSSDLKGFAKDKCPKFHDAIVAQTSVTSALEPTYRRIKEKCDAVVSDICSAFPAVFMQYNAAKRTNCRADLKELLCEHENDRGVIDRHATLHCALMYKLADDSDKWDDHKGDLCYALSNDMLCPTAINMACDRIDNKLARAYCASRFEEATCKSILDEAKNVNNDESFWSKYFG